MSFLDWVTDPAGTAFGNPIGGLVGAPEPASVLKDPTQMPAGLSNTLGLGTTNYNGPNGVNMNAYGYQGLGTQSSFANTAQAALGTQAQAINTGAADQDRAAQLGDQSNLRTAANGYQGVINGKAPSLAQMQMQQGLQVADQNARNQAANAAGGPGGLASARAATLGNALAGQNQAASSAELRAQEVAQARDAQAGLYGTIRAGDQAMQSQDFGQANQGVQNSFAQQGLNNSLYGTATNNQLGVANAETAANTAAENAQIAAQQHFADQQIAAQQAANANKAKTTGSLLNSAGGALAAIV